MIANGSSDVNGSYTLTGLPPGTYKVRANPGTTGFATQWYPNMPNRDFAAPVTITTGSNGTFDFNLGAGGNITGTITRTSDGLPLNGLSVMVVDAVTGAFVTTGSNSGGEGTYTIYGLASGSYRLRANAGTSGLISQYYLNSDSYGATPVMVTAGANTEGIDFSLPWGNSISGYVTRSSDGQPLSDLYVYAYNLADNGMLEWNMNSGTQGNGYYNITGLPAGTYKVVVWGAKTDYATKYYPNATFYYQALPIILTAGEHD